MGSVRRATVDDSRGVPAVIGCSPVELFPDMTGYLACLISSRHLRPSLIASLNSSAMVITPHGRLSPDLGLLLAI